MVTNATLHNADYIKGLGNKGEPSARWRDIRVGDMVIVQRGQAMSFAQIASGYRRPPEKRMKRRGKVLRISEDVPCLRQPRRARHQREDRQSRCGEHGAPAASHAARKRQST